MAAPSESTTCCARVLDDFDIFLFSFVEKPTNVTNSPVLDFCSKVIAFPNPRYREPRWASLSPPEVNEFYSPYVDSVIRQIREQYALKVMQVEYTHMAPYKGDILVEHDVTFDLHQQVAAAEDSLQCEVGFSQMAPFRARSHQVV